MLSKDFIKVFFAIWITKKKIQQFYDSKNLNKSLHFLLPGTLQLPPPSLPPPPPPPPIEDIPQRSPVASTRRKSFGPSQRGNYSEVENTCRRCNYSEGEGEFEQHYLVQTASGNVFVPPGKSLIYLDTSYLTPYILSRI